MQEAYVRIWRHAADFDAAIASPIAWMTTIARHAAIDMVRRGAGEGLRGSATRSTPTLPIVWPHRRPAAIGWRPASQLTACLDRLDADRRGMVVLAYCYGWSREELATRFDAAGGDGEDDPEAEPHRVEGMPRWRN